MPRPASRSALLFALSLLALAAPTTAQDAPADPSVNEAVLDVLSDDDISGDPTDLLERLEHLREAPLDVNRAGAAELAQIPALSPIVAQAIVRFREASGPFASLPGLRAVEGVTDAVYAEARAYLTIGDPLPTTAASAYPVVPAFADIVGGTRVSVLQRVQRRLDLGAGYEALPDSLAGTDDAPTRYAGSPERIYTRLQARYRRTFSANLTLEKDPGEPFTWNPEAGSYGYDFASFHLAALDVGRLDALVVGDFVAEFGQGVVLWRAAGFGKGREAVRPLVKRGRGVRPYGSTDENQFFRGAAASVAATPWLYVTAFASRRTLDASFNAPDTTDLEAPTTDATVAGLAADGLHRTPSERAKKDALGETVFGGAAEARLDRATLGVVGYAARFDAPLAPGDRPYERFGFAGDEATMAGAYANVFLGDYQLFGEVARSPSGVLGGIGGLEAALGRLDVVVLGRHFPRDFVSLHGYAFGERNGITQNERGLYLGLRLRPAQRWTVSGYVDQYRFPWVRFAVPRPATGYEVLGAVEYRPRRWLTLYVQARTETRETSADVVAPTGAVLPGLVPETRQGVRVQGEYAASRALRFRTRVEGSRYREADAPFATGLLVFQDVRWAFAKLQLDARLTLFDTDGFATRLYQFENDLTGVFQNTLLFGRGTRTYAMLTLRPGGRLDGLDLRLKLAETRFQNRRSVGSGLNEVPGDRVRDLAFQLRYRF